jgi:hypothetical protein
MIAGTHIKNKRVAACIAGHLLCKKLAIARSRLSDIEADTRPLLLKSFLGWMRLWTN